MNGLVPRNLLETKKILKRSFHIWTRSPEGIFTIWLIDPKGEKEDFSFTGRTITEVIETAWSYAQNERKALEEQKKIEEVEGKQEKT